jgi:predicted choloylglycine hydrolase
VEFHPARERVALAVEYLISSEGDIVRRLENVYTSHLIALRNLDFKSSRENELFDSIMLPIRQDKMKNGKISDLPFEEAKQIAKNILHLLVEIDRESELH